jgi:hypothetical protein
LVVFYDLTGSQALKKLVIITAIPLVATKHERQIHHITNRILPSLSHQSHHRIQSLPSLHLPPLLSNPFYAILTDLIILPRVCVIMYATR